MYESHRAPNRWQVDDTLMLLSAAVGTVLALAGVALLVLSATGDVADWLRASASSEMRETGRAFLNFAAFVTNWMAAPFLALLCIASGVRIALATWRVW